MFRTVRHRSAFGGKLFIRLGRKVSFSTLSTKNAHRKQCHSSTVRWPLELNMDHCYVVGPCAFKASADAPAQNLLAMSSVRRSARAAAAPAPSKPSEPKSDTSIDPALQPQPQPRSQSSAPSAPVDPVNDAPSDMYLSACHSVDGFLNSPSARPGNAVWNLMGQVAMVAGKEAIIMVSTYPNSSTRILTLMDTS